MENLLSTSPSRPARSGSPRTASLHLELSKYPQPSARVKLISYEGGNSGYGTGNTWRGEDNTWVGDRNYIEGRRNRVVGDENSVQGNRNWVGGSGNRVSGKGNIVQGQGNIVLGSGDDPELEATIMNRFPAWMRSGGSPLDGRRKSRSPSGLAKQIDEEMEARLPAWMRSGRKSGSSRSPVSPSGLWFPPLAYSSGRPRLTLEYSPNFRFPRRRTPNLLEEDCETDYASKLAPRPHCLGSPWSSRNWASNFRNQVRENIRRSMSKELQEDELLYH